MKKFAVIAVAASMFALAGCNDRPQVPVPPPATDPSPPQEPPSPPVPCGEPDGPPC